MFVMCRAPGQWVLRRRTSETDGVLRLRGALSTLPCGTLGDEALDMSTREGEKLRDSCFDVSTERRAHSRSAVPVRPCLGKLPSCQLSSVRVSTTHQEGWHRPLQTAPIVPK